MEEHVSRLLSLSREERAITVMELQRLYGNQRVQRVLARLVQPAGEAERSEDPNQVSPDVASRIGEQQGSGRPLDNDTLAEMETAFGHDFGDVRVHTGAEADALNREVAARAFTTGPDIFFRDGTYAPGSAQGKELLAHELTHVVQQSNAPAPGSGPARVTSPDDASEVEAADVAQSVVRQVEVARQAEEEEELQMARQVEEEEELQMARQVEEEEELQMARQAEEEEELQMARQAEAHMGEATVQRANFIEKGFNRLAQKLGYKMGTKKSKKVLESAFDGKKFDTGDVSVVTEAQIEKEWDARYGAGAYKVDGPLEGFTDPDTGEIFINKEDQAVDTVPHEILHRHEDGAVYDQMGENFNEGITEYLTQKAVSGAGFKPSSSYPNDLAVTRKLASIVGDAAIEKAYFDGEVDAMKDAVDKAKGNGTFDEAVDAMKNGDYGRAKSTLDTGVPAVAPVGGGP